MQANHYKAVCIDKSTTYDRLFSVFLKSPIQATFFMDQIDPFFISTNQKTAKEQAFLHLKSP